MLTGTGPRLHGPTMGPHGLRYFFRMQAAIIFVTAAAKEVTEGVKSGVTRRLRLHSINLLGVIKVSTGRIRPHGDLGIKRKLFYSLKVWKLA